MKKINKNIIAISCLEKAIAAMKEASIALRNITNDTNASRKADEIEGAAKIAQSWVDVLRNRTKNNKYTNVK